MIMERISQRRRIIYTFAAIATAFLMTVALTQNVYAAQDPVKYIDENGTEFQVTEYEVITKDTTEIGTPEGAWYVVNADVTISDELHVKDGCKANLLLCKDKKLKLRDSLVVNETSSLSVWGQEEKSGTLDIYGDFWTKDASLGGEQNHSNGLLEFHSGSVISVTNGMSTLQKGAAIGSGAYANAGKIRIYGGYVSSFASASGVGIGGGYGGNAGEIVISGGEVYGGFFLF